MWGTERQLKDKEGVGLLRKEFSLLIVHEFWAKNPSEGILD